MRMRRTRDPHSLAVTGRQVTGWMAVPALMFSYSLVAAVVRARTPQHLFAATTVWAAVVLVIYALYLRRGRRPFVAMWSLPRAWSSMLLVAVPAVLVGAAIAFGPHTRSHLDLVRITVLGVVGEEVVFRGLLWSLIGDLTQCTGRRSDRATLIVTSVLFAVSHVQYGGFRFSPGLAAQIGYTLIAGLALGWIRGRAASLAPGTLLHATGNAVLKLATLV